MSTNNKISLKGSFIPSTLDTVLDIRTRCNSQEDFPHITKPYVGMLIYTTNDSQLWVVTELGPGKIGATTHQNVTIKTVQTLAEFLKKTDGGLTVSEDGELMIDWDQAVKKDDLPSYQGSENITVVATEDSHVFTLDVSENVVLKKDIDINALSVDYNGLINKPTFVADEGIYLETIKAGSLNINGADVGGINGCYELKNPQASGTKRVWEKSPYQLLHNGNYWVIDNVEDPASYYYYAIGTEDPWTLTFASNYSDFGSPPKVWQATDKPVDEHTIGVDWDKVARSTDIKTYKGSEYIQVDPETGTIAITDSVALASNIIVYKEGAGINIDPETHTISCSIEPGEPVQVIAGDGLVQKDTTFNVDWSKVAKTDSVKVYSGSDHISVDSNTNVIALNDTVALKTDLEELEVDLNTLVDTKFGAIDSILDEINGEVI